MLFVYTHTFYLYNMCVSLCVCVFVYMYRVLENCGSRNDFRKCIRTGLSGQLLDVLSKCIGTDAAWISM